jgi:hypothetical protein
MCWSSTADLAAGSAITAIGAASVVGARRRRDLGLAAMPLLLGLHQLIESEVWRGQEGSVSPAVASAAATLWAVIAYPLLPAFVPVAVLFAAAPAARRWLAVFVAVGVATAAALALAVARGPVTAHAVGHTMRYDLPVPAGSLLLAGYLVATVGALLMSEHRDVRLLGAIGAVAAVACYGLWQTAFVSTWCAWAAVISVVVFRWARRPQPTLPKRPSLDSVAARSFIPKGRVNGRRRPPGHS